MLCYRDMTFCTSPYCKGECGRELTEEVRAAADKAGLPISCQHFCKPTEDEKALEDYIDSYP
jgi:hypothetical protein